MVRGLTFLQRKHLEWITRSRKSYSGYRNLLFAGCTFLGGVNICTFCRGLVSCGRWLWEMEGVGSVVADLHRSSLIGTSDSACICIPNVKKLGS